MHDVGDSGITATRFSELVSSLETGGRKFYLVFRPLIPVELINRRCEDLARVVQVVPNRPRYIRSITNDDTQEQKVTKSVNYTPWNPPDDAVQILLGGPAYVNRYQNRNFPNCTKRISRFEDLRNKFCKFFKFLTKELVFDRNYLIYYNVLFFSHSTKSS